MKPRGPAPGSAHKDGLHAMLQAFFEARPDEHLSVCDASVKFGYRKSAVREFAGRMRKLGKLAPGYPIRLPGVEA